ncbi:hypothetical protein SLA2020_214050 [Shorea laevis]
MQSVLLPKATCDNIDRLNRDFLWGRSSGTHKLHLVGWDVVCSEKRLVDLDYEQRGIITKLLSPNLVGGFSGVTMLYGAKFYGINISVEQVFLMLRLHNVPLQSGVEFFNADQC